MYQTLQSTYGKLLIIWALLRIQCVKFYKYCKPQHSFQGSVGTFFSGVKEVAYYFFDTAEKSPQTLENCSVLTS